MEVLLYILGGLFLLAGMVGALVPVLPGPPLSYIGLLLFHFSDKFQFSTRFLIIWGVIAALVTLVDYVVPLWGTKRFGGTKMGVRGATVGLIIGIFFFPPIGIILGPFFGAMIGELIQNSDDFTRAVRSAFGSLLGFLMGTGLKMIVALMLIYYVIAAI
jgi:uncharacterized protein YqgC (DUF456 family)